MQRTIVVLAFATIVGGALAASKKTDADILARVSRVASKKVTAVMPETASLAGPLAALTPADLMPVADRVRVRLRTDQQLDGALLTVVASGGEVTLRGEVKTAAQRLRAVELAQSTTGVTKVTSELSEPAK